MTDLHTQPGLDQLTDAELIRLIRNSDQCESGQCERARETLVDRYQTMVRSLALRYRLPAQYYEDLIQVGYVGLIKAINNFDPGISQNLRPYAHACVSGEIKRFFRDKRWVLRVSRTDQELLLSAKQAQASLTAELGGEPTDDQVADRLNVSTDDLRRAYQAHDAFAPGSLDAPMSQDDDRDIGEFVGFDDPAIERSTDMDAIRRHWHELPPPQRRILLMRFYGNMTQSQVADRLHYSQMHVSRLQTRALTFLRGRLLAD